MCQYRHRGKKPKMQVYSFFSRGVRREWVANAKPRPF
jgi:hypothetical protein